MVQRADSSSLAIYGVIHISLGHISSQVHILGVLCHLFICTFTLSNLGGLHAFRKPLPYNMYLFNLLFANHILIKIFFFKLKK